MSGELAYVYGFAEAAPHLPPPPTSGVEERVGVEWVLHNGIAALVSFVPARAYSEAVLARRIQDAAWLAYRAERHNGVLLDVLGQVTVVPCRFATLLRGRRRLAEAIADQRRAIKENLRRLRDRVEWSIKAFAAGTPDVPASTSMLRMKRAETGTAYLLAREHELTSRRMAAEDARERTQEIESAIAPMVEGIVRLPLQAAVDDHAREPVLNLACLVHRSGTRPLEGRLRRLAALQRRHGTTLSWSGPWPGYNFVGRLP